MAAEFSFCLSYLSSCYLHAASLIYLFHFQGKKSKKKPKQATKETKIVTADNKEPEEGEIDPTSARLP